MVSILLFLRISGATKDGSSMYNVLSTDEKRDCEWP